MAKLEVWFEMFTCLLFTAGCPLAMLFIIIYGYCTNQIPLAAFIPLLILYPFIQLICSLSLPNIIRTAKSKLKIINDIKNKEENNE